LDMAVTEKGRTGGREAFGDVGARKSGFRPRSVKPRTKVGKIWDGGGRKGERGARKFGGEGSAEKIPVTNLQLSLRVNLGEKTG